LRVGCTVGGLVDLIRPQGGEEAAEKGIVRGEKHPAGAEARVILLALAARLKSCPFKAIGFSAAGEVVP